MSDNNQKFKICLTMAGAVSAGAFTAGVMDYLLETLELWEKAKEKNRALTPAHGDYDFSLPMHEVEIDVISGASAGGIVGSLALLHAVDPHHQPLNRENPLGRNNRFYQTWVTMADDEKSDTLQKLLDTTDLKKLKKGEKPKALLNATPIDDLANTALKLGETQAYPNYISKGLDLIMTTTNLRGINFKIDFGGNAHSGATITNHGGFFRYKLANKYYKPGIPRGSDLYYVLDLNRQQDMQALKEATLSTAAFPIGLPSREVSISQEYINRYPKYLFGTSTGIEPIRTNNPIYTFNSIDGGIINNEPFAIALKVLREKAPLSWLKEQYAVIMIDPFANKDQEQEDENPVADVITVAKGMFKALRNQVMFNRDGILDALSASNSSRFLIEPVRKSFQFDELLRIKNDLATAPLFGFAGFIDQSFRQHDYELGRQNCQSFLRYYFVLSEAELIKKLGAMPHEMAMDRFFVHTHADKNGRHFPIVPDIRVLNARLNRFDADNYGADAALDYPDYPSISTAEFNKKYKKAIRKRMEMLSNILVSNFWFSLANKLFIRNRLSKEIEREILDELRYAGLIKDD
ncbi:patatin-like phospholipase family protein [Flavobacterium sp. JP2137]|uniref:patatin-like phospholipase family protein n=1 Tax=Flavobacterium sp. JP2137 TaxID=3414510 RepID=UPI003D2FA4E1